MMIRPDQAARVSRVRDAALTMHGEEVYVTFATQGPAVTEYGLKRAQDQSVGPILCRRSPLRSDEQPDSLQMDGRVVRKLTMASEAYEPSLNDVALIDGYRWNIIDVRPGSGSGSATYAIIARQA